MKRTVRGSSTNAAANRRKYSRKNRLEFRPPVEKMKRRIIVLSIKKLIDPPRLILALLFNETRRNRKIRKPTKGTEYCAN